MTPSVEAMTSTMTTAGVAVSSNNNNNTTTTTTTATTTMEIPKSMVDALNYDDPCAALIALSNHSQDRARILSEQLVRESLGGGVVDGSSTNSTTSSNSNDGAISTHMMILPELLRRLPNTNDIDSHPVATAIACADSILHSLTKIASGGSQASLEIKQLEQEKRELEEHATDVETALRLRKASDVASQSLSAQRYEQASVAVQDYNILMKKHRLTARAQAYAGEYTVTQLESSKRALRATLLQDYQDAVQSSDLQLLGRLTPLLQMVEYEKEAVSLYLRFLKGILQTELEKAALSGGVVPSSTGGPGSTPPPPPPPPYIPMARVYNSAVTILRHHLPMVSHCLHKADGDAAVVQLVNVQVEQAVLPLFQKYLSNRQLSRSARNSQKVYGILESRLSSGMLDGGSGGTGGSALDYLGGGGTGGGGSDGSSSKSGRGGTGGSGKDGSGLDDAGFTANVGTLADVDASLEEAALCLQHAESYTRFIQHTVREVNKARALRYENEKNERRIERERKEWSTGMSSSTTTTTHTSNGTSNKDNSKVDDDDDDDDDEMTEYTPLEILPAHTQLQESVAEVGGYYSAIEACLLLASMQRAFAINPNDARQYSSLSIVGAGSSNSKTTGTTHAATVAMGGGPLQTSLVESSLYATRRGAQRAFATGHTGTASAVSNQFAECLRSVLVGYMSRRADDLGVSPLKPGEGLLTGSASIFGSTTLTMAGRQLAHQSGMGGHGSTHHHHQGGGGGERQRQQQEIQSAIAWACATLNDLEVAAHHTIELERLLLQSVDRGFPPNTHETDQLRLCVKSFGPVAEMFTLAADESIESLVSVLKPRLRAIVTDAVGGDHGTAHGGGVVGASGFSSVIGGAGGMTKSLTSVTDRHAVRMNYDLDEEAYQLLEVSESYISRLCTQLDEILVPLSRYLAPRLADLLVLGVLGTVSKRLEVSLKKCRFTALGALSLDSDMRDLLNYAKDRLTSNELNSSNVALYRACAPLSRLVQIAKLMNLDDLEDVLDLISSSKRKGNWDLKLEESRTYLCLRVEFEADRVGQLLRATASAGDEE